MRQLSTIACLLCLTLARHLAAAETADYSVADPGLKVIRLDSAPTESFLAVKADTTGRLFIGGREALFVYELDVNGGYQPRRELMHFPDHTWVYDIEIRGDDLYILTVTALYRIPGGRLKREGLEAQRLIWGVPSGHVHQCFHGMTFGPEGDLYFAMGDPLWYYGDFSRADHWGHWTFFSRKSAKPQASDAGGTWERTPYTGVGGVFRCRPDGSGFQVVATGLRNSCGLTFDRDWNLFSNDNDHESMPAEYVPGRLNHVTPQAYFSWPRGWMPSKTPDRLDLLETMNTRLGRFVPVGQSYYDDNYLPKQYRNSLLVARWCTRQITYYPLKHRGATFQCDEHLLLAGHDLARPVHVTVGRGGRIFATICYMAHNEGSPVYKSDLVMITRADDADDHPFEAYDAPTAKLNLLWQELSSPSWSRRKEAHLEILRRRAFTEPELIQRWNDLRTSDLVRSHLIWFMAFDRGTESLSTLPKATWHVDDSIRLQAIRAIKERLPNSGVHEERWLEEANPQVQHAAILCEFGSDGKLPEQIITGAARSDDTYLRQAATRLMAEKSNYDQLGNLMQSGDAKARLAGVLAAGFRLTIPPATGEISADLPLAAWRNPDEAYKIRYIDGTVDLRDYGRMGTFTVAEHWKAGNHTQEQERLFALLAARLGDEDEKVRLQAAHFLSLLDDERTEPVIARVRADIQKSRLGTAAINPVTAVWAIGPFADASAEGWRRNHALEAQPFDSAATFRRKEGQPLAWKQLKPLAGRLFDFGAELGAKDESTSYAFLRLESGTKQMIELLLGTDNAFKVHLNGQRIASVDADRSALPFQDVITLELQPGANDLLIRVRGTAEASRLYLHYRSLQPVAAVLPERLEGATLAERLKEAAANPDQSKIDPKFLEVDWSQATAQGDAGNGKKLFSADGLGCAKCHAATADAPATGGPSLADAGKRFTVAHLVESVLLPNKTISPVFKATSIVTKEGKTYTGLVTGETAEKIEMILSDTNKVTIAPGDVDERKLQDVSPMPAGMVKTPDELRDLLAFLLSEGQGGK